MASLTQWTWIWVISERWWWIGRPGVVQSMGLQRIGHDWVTELNSVSWTYLILPRKQILIDLENERSQREKGRSLSRQLPVHPAYLQLSIVIILFKNSIFSPTSYTLYLLQCFTFLWHTYRQIYFIFSGWLIWADKPSSLNVCACVLNRFSCVQLCATLWTVACQAPLSTGFSRQEYWSVLPCPPAGDLHEPSIEPKCPMTLALVDGFFTTEPLGKSYLLGLSTALEAHIRLESCLHHLLALMR